jgi:hypothetical protein
MPGMNILGNADLFEEALINEDFCSLARREYFSRRGILKIFRALKNVSNAARE